MNTGQIFSFGDIEMVRMSLEAVALIFNSPELDGGSLIVLATIIALMTSLLPAAFSGGKKLDLVPFLVVLMIFFAGIKPKMKITIEDYYTGAVVQVANVPLIVGMPASLAASISYKLAGLMESTMTTPDTKKTFREGGFSDPLKIIYSMRPAAAASANIYWSRTLETFIGECAIWSPNWNTDTALKSPALDTYIFNATALPVVGLTIYYSTAKPSGVSMTCADAQDKLKTSADLNQASPFLSSAHLDALIKKGAVDRPVAFVQGEGQTKITEAFNDVTNGALAGSQNAQNFILSMAAAIPLGHGIKCGDKTTAAYPSCIQAREVEVAMEQTRIDQAAGASVFAKVAIPMMNIIMMFFYIFSPILLIVAMMMPAKAMQIIGGYIMFAIWTQSWLPTAMGINYIINMQYANSVAVIASGGVTADNYFQFYSALATKLGLASELFAAIPILTMALLSGSVYGLQSVAGKMSPRDSFEESNLAPEIAKTDAAAHKAAWVETSVGGIRIIDNQNMDSFHNDNSAKTAFENLDVGSKLSTEAKTAEEKSKADEAKLQETLKSENVVQIAENEQAGYAQNLTSTKAFQRSTGNKNSIDVRNSLSKTSGLKDTSASKLDAAIAMKASGNGAAISKTFGQDFADKFEQGLQETKSETSEKMAALTQSFSEQDSHNMGETWARSVGIKNSNEYGKTVGQSFASKKTASDSLTRSNNVGLSKVVNMGEIGSQALLAGKDEYSVVESAIAMMDKARETSGQEKMTDEEKTAFRQKIANQVDANATVNGGSNISSGRTGWAMQALAKDENFGVGGLVDLMAQNGIGTQTQAVQKPADRSAVADKKGDKMLGGASGVGTKVDKETNKASKMVRDSNTGQIVAYSLSQLNDGQGVHGAVASAKSSTQQVGGQINRAEALERMSKAFLVPEAATPEMAKQFNSEFQQIGDLIDKAEQEGVKDPWEYVKEHGTDSFVMQALFAGGGLAAFDALANSGGRLDGGKKRGKFGNAKAGIKDLSSGKIGQFLQETAGKVRGAGSQAWQATASTASRGATAARAGATALTAFFESASVPAMVAAGSEGTAVGAGAVAGEIGAGAALGLINIFGGTAALAVGTAGGYILLDQIDEASDGAVGDGIYEMAGGKKVKEIEVSEEQESKMMAAGWTKGKGGEWHPPQNNSRGSTPGPTPGPTRK